MSSFNRHKVYVLLSGGIDSTTTLAIAAREFPEAEFECVTVDYGQRHKKEAHYAGVQAYNFNGTQVSINAKGLMEGLLVDQGASNEPIPDVDYSDLPVGISPTYVSFRNGLMLSLVAARAQAWVMAQEKKHNLEVIGGYIPAELAQFEATIYCGVHADDGVNWAYPDCTPEFIGGMANAIYIGTYDKVRLRAPLLYMDKAAVVREGVRLGVDYSQTWSCYKGEELHCGVCPTCRSRRKAFSDNGFVDPTTYAQDI